MTKTAIEGRNCSKLAETTTLFQQNQGSMPAYAKQQLVLSLITLKRHANSAESWPILGRETCLYRHTEWSAVSLASLSLRWFLSTVTHDFARQTALGSKCCTHGSHNHHTSVSKLQYFFLLLLLTGITNPQETVNSMLCIFSLLDLLTSSF